MFQSRFLSLRVRVLWPIAAVFTAGLLGGCPAAATCPNCKYRTASFTLQPGEVGAVTSAQMSTQINHPPSTTGSDNCPITGDPVPCVTTRTDVATCKIAAATAQRIGLPVQSVDTASHSVNVVITTAAGSRTAAATVGPPASPGDSLQSHVICP